MLFHIGIYIVPKVKVIWQSARSQDDKCSFFRYGCTSGRTSWPSIKSRLKIRNCK